MILLILLIMFILLAALGLPIAASLGITSVFVLLVIQDVSVAVIVQRIFSGIDSFTYVVEDGCRGVELAPGDSARALEAMHKAGVEIVSSGEVLNAAARIHPAAALSVNA